MRTKLQGKMVQAIDPQLADHYDDVIIHEIRTRSGVEKWHVFHHYDYHYPLRGWHWRVSSYDGEDSVRDFCDWAFGIDPAAPVIEFHIP